MPCNKIISTFPNINKMSIQIILYLKYGQHRQTLFPFAPSSPSLPLAILFILLDKFSVIVLES